MVAMTTWQAQHTMHCAERGVRPALGNGVILTMLQMGTSGGAPANLPMSFALNVGFVYSYVVLQCPLEALQGRQSLMHNVFAGGTLGYLGVNAGRLGMFGMEHHFYINRIPLPIGGAILYGAMGGILGAIGGKSL